MNLSVFEVVPLLLFASAAIVVWTLWPDPTDRAVRQRLQSTMGQGRGSLLLAQLSALFDPINSRLPLGRYTRWVERKQEAAGSRVPALQFLVAQELWVVLTVAAAAYLMGMKVVSANPAWLVIACAAGLALPVFLLNSRIKARRESISKDLPEVVDLLTLCVGAGADFMSSLSRIVREFRASPVRDELAITLSEIRVGKRRRDALRALADRVQTTETSTFARTLIQADRMGTGLVEALNVLSEDMRLQRYHWAERFAQRAPLKMLVPLVMSLGASLTIVAGPILVTFIRGDFMNPKRYQGTVQSSTMPRGSALAPESQAQ